MNSQGPSFFHHLPNSKQTIRHHNKAEQKNDLRHFESAKKSTNYENNVLKLQAQAHRLDKESIKMILAAAR